MPGISVMPGNSIERGAINGAAPTRSDDMGRCVYAPIQKDGTAERLGRRLNQLMTNASMATKYPLDAACFARFTVT